MFIWSSKKGFSNEGRNIEIIVWYQLFLYSILFIDRYSHIEINLIFYLLQKKNMDGFVSVKSKNVFTIKYWQEFSSRKSFVMGTKCNFCGSKKKLFLWRQSMIQLKKLSNLWKNFIEKSRLMKNRSSTFYAVFKNTENCTLTAKRRL